MMFRLPHAERSKYFPITCDGVILLLINMEVSREIAIIYSLVLLPPFALCICVRPYVLPCFLSCFSHQSLPCVCQVLCLHWKESRLSIRHARPQIIRRRQPSHKHISQWLQAASTMTTSDMPPLLPHKATFLSHPLHHQQKALV